MQYPEMNSRKAKIATRIATSRDTSELCALLNEIIDIGGTTALQSRLTQDEFRDYFLQGGSHISCYLAVDALGLIAGFQSLERHSKLPDNWADIATFARVKRKTAGVGTALFARSSLFARQSGIFAINATIRADNTGGLIYYEKMGFQTYAVNNNIPLDDGTPVDRVSKRYFVA
jgi:hypothetical protein